METYKKLQVWLKSFRLFLEAGPAKIITEGRQLPQNFHEYGFILATQLKQACSDFWEYGFVRLLFFTVEFISG